MSFFKDRGIKGIVFSLALSLLFIIIHLSNLFTPIDNFIMDNLLQSEGKVSGDIKIIAIDDKSLDELGKMDTWDRSYYASLIEKLNSDGHNPSVIGFDILFSGRSDNSEADNRLVKAVKDSDNVILGMNLIFENSFSDNKVGSSITPSLPFKELNEVSSKAYVNTVLDRSDSYVRKVVVEIDSYESFSYSIYKKHMVNLGKDFNRYNKNEYYRFKYSAKPNTAYTIVSLTDILNDRIPLDDFKNSIVLVGAYATGLGDDFYTPIKRGSKMYGVEIHANLIDAYINDNLLKDSNSYLNLFISTLIIFILSFVLFKSKGLASSIILIISGALLLLLEFTLLKFNLYYPFNFVILFIAFIYVIEIAYSYLTERKAKLETINAFKKYVGEEVVLKAIKNGRFDINLGGEKRNVACLFVDIRGFTSMSEAMEPGEVVEILNSYLTLVTEAIFKNGGTLDKFIGDAAMALFNAPFDLDDYVFKACKCAIDIRSCSEKLDKECLLRFNRSVGFGIGVNVGEAVVGNIGSSERMDYTAIGDTINTASRLEGSAKRSEIIISKAVYEIVKDRINAEFVGELNLKGKKEGFSAYRIINLKEEAKWWSYILYQALVI